MSSVSGAGVHSFIVGVVFGLSRLDVTRYIDDRPVKQLANQGDKGFYAITAKGKLTLSRDRINDLLHGDGDFSTGCLEQVKQ